jgi:Family of unknown function (DUF5330)
MRFELHRVSTRFLEPRLLSLTLTGSGTTDEPLPILATEPDWVSAMGLFKVGAVLAVGVVLLPAEREKQDQLYERAGAAAKWTITFCDRNFETCVQASKAWAQFTAKAEFGAKLAYDVIREQTPMSGGETGISAPAAFAPNGTLSQHDLRPAWRGKSAASKRGI